MKQLTFLLVIVGTITMLLGCEQAIQSGCRPVTESIYVNDRFPSAIDQYHPDSLRVFMFELAFNDSVSVLVGNRLAAKGYLATKSNGFAGQLRINAQPNEEITLNATNGCAHFKLKEGYKYLYISRSETKKWEVAYSNFSRGYF